MLQASNSSSKMYISWKFAHPQEIQDVEFVSLKELEKVCITSLVYQWILCSEWVPKQLIKLSQTSRILWGDKLHACNKQIHH